MLWRFPEGKWHTYSNMTEQEHLKARKTPQILCAVVLIVRQILRGSGCSMTRLITCGLAWRVHQQDRQLSSLKGGMRRQEDIEAWRMQHVL